MYDRALAPEQEPVEAIPIAVVGLGKMGLSHLAILGGLPDYRLSAACDPSPLYKGSFTELTGIKLCPSFDALLEQPGLKAAVLATPSAAHEGLLRRAIAAGLHVFCEKPLTLSPSASADIAALAEGRSLITQVGYHYRFVGTFREVKRLLQLGAIGRASSASAAAFGPVVVRPGKATWRSKRSEGGGALFDYAAHAINLLNWYFGPVSACRGASMGSIFSPQVEDEVQALLSFGNGVNGQVTVNWSDVSVRKMTTQVSISGTGGRIEADRQELRLFLTGSSPVPEGYAAGWNVRNITELTDKVSFYLRGEEYSAQLEHFAASIRTGMPSINHDFRSAALTDAAIGLIRDAARGAVAPEPGPRTAFLRRLIG